MPQLNISLFLVLFTATITLAIILWVGLVLLYAKQRKSRDVGAGLGLSLFLISVPEGRTAESNPEEQQKRFIAQMEQLLIGLGTLKRKGTAKSLWKNPVFALEIATHHKGADVFFYIAFPRAYATVLRSQIHGIFPDAHIEQVPDYNIFHPEGASAIAVIRQKEPSPLPIKTYMTLSADSLEIITSSFSKLKHVGEGAAIQLLLRVPTKNYETGFRKALLMLKEGKSRNEAFRKKGFFHRVSNFISPKQPESAQQKPKQTDESAIKAVEAKSAKMIFECNIRLVSSAANAPEADRILNELKAGFLQFQNPEGNSFALRDLSGRAFYKAIEQFSFRLFNNNYAMALNVEELVSVYHFPFSRKSAPTVKMLKSKEATPPANLSEEGIVIGKSSFRGEEKIVSMAMEDRRRHFYILGQTGTGKSTLLKNMIAQDIRAGNGVAVIDPHGDVVEYALSMIPKERAEDVIHFNPGDTAYPMGLNMLEYDTNYPEYKSLIVNELIEIFNKLFDMKIAGGPMFEQYFRNAAGLVMEDPESGNTLLEVRRVFGDKAFRDYKLSRCKNVIISSFWREVAEKTTGEQSLANMATYVVSKFDVFLSNDIMRPIILQQKSSFNFREIMDQKKILLLNLAKGKLGETNANLIGMIITGKLLIAALSRTDIPNESDRKDFFFYIDEFQNVTTKSIATILAEARKYRLNLTIAHQYLGQLEEEIKKAVFGNVGSMLAFRIGAEDAEVLKQHFEPVFSAHDLANIDNLNAYFKPLIKGLTSKPFNIKLYPFPPEKGDIQIAESIKQLSRFKYARRREEVETEIKSKYESL